MTGVVVPLCRAPYGSRRLSPDPLRFIWPRHTAKHVAGAFAIALRTARDWLRDGVPFERRIERATIIERGLDAIAAEIRRQREGD